MNHPNQNDWKIFPKIIIEGSNSKSFFAETYYALKEFKYLQQLS